jgi:solute:Na+ symporter, SSS family
MSIYDWFIVLIPSAIVAIVAWRASLYVNGTGDFLTAGRAGGRFLVSCADGLAGMGLITAIGMFEEFQNAGFGVIWWRQLGAPVMLMIALFGFIAYRFRQTRAMTMAQFLELRYSRRFRIFMGITAFVAGIVNYGIFPIVSARFLIHYCHFPMFLNIGSLHVPNEALLSGGVLLIALYFVLRGGQMQVMLTDFLQTMFCGVLFIIVAVAVLWKFSGNQMFAAMTDREPGKSMLNPFDTGQLGDFNIWYVIIAIFSSVYTYMSWQGNQGFNASALNAHEAKMGKVVAAWRQFGQAVMFALLGLAVVTYLKNPDFAAGAAHVSTQVDQIAGASGTAIAKQMTAPVAISDFLPIGVKGCFAFIMIGLMVSTDTSYLHSWGSIFVQDVLQPLAGHEIEPKRHMLLLRGAIVGVALFAFVFGLVFPQTSFIFFFFNVTGAIYLGGAGAAIIGGLYWKRGTAAGAWSAMIVGSGLAVGGVLAPVVADKIFGHAWPLNQNWMTLISMLGGIGTYTIVSLLTCRRPLDMDELLHRGRFAVAEDVMAVRVTPSVIPAWQQKFLGFDEHYSRADRRLSLLLLAWTSITFGAFVVIVLLNAFGPRWSERAWWNYFSVLNIYVPLVIGAITTVWFTRGGLRDLRRLFDKLRHGARDADDSGFVDQPIDADRCLEPDVASDHVPIVISTSPLFADEVAKV